MKEMSKAIELKAKTKLIHYLTVENTKLKEQVFSIDRNNMILPIHQWHATNTKFKQLEKENADLKLQLADTLGRFEYEMDLNTKVMKENAELKQQLDRLHKNEIIYHKKLADIKYLKPKEVMDILEQRFGFTWTCTAICNLAYDKDKINELLLDQLYRFEGIMGKYNCGLDCEFQTAFHRLIRAEIGKIKDEILNDKDISNQPPNPIPCKNPDCYSKDGEIIKEI